MDLDSSEGQAVSRTPEAQDRLPWFLSWFEENSHHTWTSSRGQVTPPRLLSCSDAAARPRAPGSARVAVGGAADLLVIDLGSIFDASSDAQPQAHPQGIELVIVTGQVVLRDGKHTGALPGQRLPH